MIKKRKIEKRYLKWRLNRSSDAQNKIGKVVVKGDSSAKTKMRSSAMIAAVEIRLIARGCMLSHPNPVPAGNVAHACSAAVTHSGGMA